MRATAGAVRAGMRLDAAVGAMEEVGSRAEAQRLIDAGRVLVDGEPRPKRHKLAASEVIEVRPMAPPVSDLVPEPSVPFRIAYEDADLIVVNKPAGVVTHPSAGHRDGTLVHGLLAHAVAGGGDPTRPGSCTAWTATRAGSWWSRGRSGRTGGCSGCCATGRSGGSTRPSCTGPFRPR